ncbi:protein of unknown function [Xenorhabdus doucetiae]|uniref:Uncharacterized protein n=1 Tax=Xenorhabdus doucetiae TaxID=351671 RepID=A0A068QMW7_9GAMM|nr:protein of unknown function [Xenorhabdus doucetiae]
MLKNILGENPIPNFDDAKNKQKNMSKITNLFFIMKNKEEYVEIIINKHGKNHRDAAKM